MKTFKEFMVESHFKMGDKVKCKKSGMTGEVVSVDKPEVGKYYSVKREDGETMKYAPSELSLVTESQQVDEVLDPSKGAGEYIKDFRKSDAPQFKGKSKEKRTQMAIAAYMSAKRKNEEVELEETEQLDEISKELARKYMAKAGKQLDKGAGDKADKRIDGYWGASKRLSDEKPTSK